MAGLLGNEQVRDIFTSLISEERLHHCYLFEGPSGVGKGAYAKWIVKIVNCTAETNESCGKCWSCQMIEAGTHPDILEVGYDPERTAKIISVRQAREIVERIESPPFRAKTRFVIIDPADAMRDEAANALLKTFEEPPDHTKFILISQSAHRLLPTIRSRSQRVRFRPVSDDSIIDWLKEMNCSRSTIIARLSGGCPGAAIRLMHGEIDAWIQLRDELILQFTSSTEDRFLYSASVTKGKKETWSLNIPIMLDVLQSICRDLVLTLSGKEDQLLNADIVDLLKEWAPYFDEEMLYDLFIKVEQVRKDLELYVNTRLLLDALLSHYADAWRSVAD